MKTKTKYKLYKIMNTMMTKLIYCGLWVVMVLALMVLVSPVFLIFSVGNDGEMTVWNFVGIGWLCLLVYVFNVAEKRMNHD